MTVYAKVTGSALIQYPYTFGDMMAENPYTIFPANTDIAAVFPQTDSAVTNGWSLAPVEFLPQPSFDPSSQVCVQDLAPILVNNIWTVGWTVRAMGAQEQADATMQKTKSVRADRDQLLANTDWRILKSYENGGLEQSVWVSYRQALRDVPAQAGFPWNVTWPTEPGV
jgi:hypothetical protein